MDSLNLIIIIAAEICAVLVLLCMFLVFKNRSLRGLVNKLQARMEQLVQDLRKARTQKQPNAASGTNYKQLIQEQLRLTQNHHANLNPSQDIVLDIDPATPTPLRAAALRHAILTIELDAIACRPGIKPDWKQVNQKYDQLFRFQDEYADTSNTEENSDENPDENEISSLIEELAATKKRVNNLEKFKALYFELEEKWQSCKNTAQTHFDELSGMVAHVEQKEPFEQALQAYHASYDSVADTIQRGVDQAEAQFQDTKNDNNGEIRHLRAVAADQHKIINELQRKLENINSEEERQEAVEALQDQLQKQTRFIQESETCIQLLEDELSNTNKELETLKSRLNVLPQLKTNLRDLREANEEYEMQVYTLRAANQRLTKEAKSKKAAPASDDAQTLKKALTEMETKYADLEERFLDLKING